MLDIYQINNNNNDAYNIRNYLGISSKFSPQTHNKSKPAILIWVSHPIYLSLYFV